MKNKSSLFLMLRNCEISTLGMTSKRSFELGTLRRQEIKILGGSRR